MLMQKTEAQSAVTDILQNRRCARCFTKEKVSEEHIEQLIKAGLWSPSSKNRYPWEFLIVDQEEVIEKLSYAKQEGIEFIRQAPLLIVVSVDPEISDAWIEDAAVASHSLQLEAESLGLGSCWVQIRGSLFNEEQTSGDFVKEILGMPSHLKVLSIIAVGHKKFDKSPHSEDELHYSKVSRNYFGSSFR